VSTVETVCASCHRDYSLRDECEPTKYCDACAHERVAELEAQVAALYKAVKYVLDRSQTDPDLGYQVGPGMQSFFLLCEAEAAFLGKPLTEVEPQRRKDLQPEHCKREPEVLRLRKELEEARR
jgi:hypothetical protein